MKIIYIIVLVLWQNSLMGSAYARTGIPPLPEPVTNNAVALVETDDASWLVSFMGLGATKDWRDVHNKVWAYRMPTDQSQASQWQSRKAVPSSLPLKGRLAAIAVGLNGKAWLFGGYTVAEDHSEISSPDNFAYDVVKDDYKKLSPMPVPVDDAVALVYQNRYIYLISGWHNDGNVNLTQVYDTQTDSWQQASPFLGRPVFGQAGGIVDHELLICDGVKVVPLPDKRRTFASETACYKGSISSENHLKIDWRTVKHPTGMARYRMAATGIVSGDSKGVIFIGGSHNPYNYNGIGYDTRPSSPDEQIWFYDFVKEDWHLTKNTMPTMDHRGLLEVHNRLVIPGGMSEQQKVLSRVTTFDKLKLLTSIIKD